MMAVFKDNIRGEFLCKVLLYLLIILGIYFKYLGIVRYGLNFYVIILFFAISVFFMAAYSYGKNEILRICFC